MSARSFTRCLMATIGILMLFSPVPLGASAQGATPEASPPIDLERASANPVSIHQGTCQDFVAQPVGPAIDTGVAGFGETAEFIGINTQLPVLVASADYDGTLAYFTEAPHVVVIHQSSEDFGTVIACGQIAGYEHDGRLVFAIRSTSDVPVNGVAIFEENTTVVDEALDLIDRQSDFGDDSIHVTVYIVSGDIEAGQEG